MPIKRRFFRRARSRTTSARQMLGKQGRWLRILKTHSFDTFDVSDPNTTAPLQSWVTPLVVDGDWRGTTAAEGTSASASFQSGARHVRTVLYITGDVTYFSVPLGDPVQGFSGVPTTCAFRASVFASDEDELFVNAGSGGAVITVPPDPADFSTWDNRLRTRNAMLWAINEDRMAYREFGWNSSNSYVIQDLVTSTPDTVFWQSLLCRTWQIKKRRKLNNQTSIFLAFDVVGHETNVTVDEDNPFVRSKVLDIRQETWIWVP